MPYHAYHGSPEVRPVGVGVEPTASWELVKSSAKNSTWGIWNGSKPVEINKEGIWLMPLIFSLANKGSLSCYC